MTPITKKQYIFSSARLELPDMKECSVGENYLYADGKLNITKCKTSDGVDVYILGNAFCTDKKDKSVSEDVALHEEKDLPEISRFWTGRFVVVTENMLFTDACALMSAFYIEKDGEFFVSSSLAVLSQVFNVPIEGKVNSTHLTWQLLPHTLIPCVKALMCTQKMSFENGKMSVLPCMWMKDRTHLTTEEKCSAVSQMLENAVHNIHKFSGKRIVIALTGGKDSRVTFSALVKSGVPFSAYTAEHDNISSADKTVPKKLCSMFGVSHTYIKKKKMSHDKLCDYMNFCGNNSNGADALFYARGQFDGFGEDIIILRSGLYEAGQSYSRGLAGGDSESFENGIKSYYRNDFSRNVLQKTAFDEWLLYVKDNPTEFVDVRDRFYIEQRAGGWVSAIEQSLDINDFTSIQIANCKELLSVLLSCSEIERKELSLSYETVKLMCEKALEVEVNKRTLGDKLIPIKMRIRNYVKSARKIIGR